ncbi:hypothetical protein ZHAS_00013648 [Anopheles sinensis]|uniref:Uncharacterized protein n=1 Tax=Anopheles sinensis TaxID=74873 RepID=A0A084W656_ANOSI|nr:hypothetical protein ZHAS_00013648 [Anopheles sinensis]
MLPLPSAGSTAAAANGRNTGTPSEVVVDRQQPHDAASSILRPVNLRNNPLDGTLYFAGPSPREPQYSVNSSNFDNASVLSDSSSTVGGAYGAVGDPNQVGLPPAGGQKRWIPHQQRELLEKQAQLLLSGAAIKRKRETEIL